MRRPAAALLVLALAACGIPPDDAPRALSPSAAPALLPGGASAPPAAGLQVRVWLVRDRRLVAVEREVERPGALLQVAQALVAGPTADERAAGLSTALPDGVGVQDVQRAGPVAVVTLSRTAGTPDDGVPLLAVAQLVTTLGARPGVAAVRFRDAAGPVQVPRADGTLTDSPVDAGAYAALLAAG